MKSIRLIPALSLLGLSACADYNVMGDIGAAPGGSQDIAYARSIIESGGVPDSESFRIGGLLNEHDLPIVGEAPCAERLCISGASGSGWVPTLAQDAVFMQVGYDSNLSSASFEREPLNLVVVIDISGSMSPYMDDLKVALNKLVDQLDGEDRVAIVTYGNRPKVLVDSTPGDRKDKLRRKIDGLSSGGSTAMEAGMEKGFELIQSHTAPGVESRMMLFTDVKPNVGATGVSAFEVLVQDAAEQGMGLSLFGVGLDFGYEIAESISQVRGGNYFYLSDDQRVAEVFDADFDLLVTPLAYDLSVEIRTSMAPIDGYNIQALEDGDGGLVRLDVATVFANRNNGASMLLLERPEELAPDARIAGMSLSFEEPDGDVVEQEVELTLSGEAGGLEGDSFSQTGTRKGAALMNMGLAMEALCSAYWEGGSTEQMEAISEAYWLSRDRLALEAGELGDAALEPEVLLMDTLAENAGLARPQEPVDTGA